MKNGEITVTTADGRKLYVRQKPTLGCCTISMHCDWVNLNHEDVRWAFTCLRCERKVTAALEFASGHSDVTRFPRPGESTRPEQASATLFESDEFHRLVGKHLQNCGEDGARMLGALRQVLHPHSTQYAADIAYRETETR